MHIRSLSPANNGNNLEDHDYKQLGQNEYKINILSDPVFSNDEKSPLNRHVEAKMELKVDSIDIINKYIDDVIRRTPMNDCYTTCHFFYALFLFSFSIGAFIAFTDVITYKKNGPNPDDPDGPKNEEESNQALIMGSVLTCIVLFAIALELKDLNPVKIIRNSMLKGQLLSNTLGNLSVEDQIQIKEEAKKLNIAIDTTGDTLKTVINKFTTRLHLEQSLIALEQSTLPQHLTFIPEDLTAKQNFDLAFFIYNHCLYNFDNIDKIFHNKYDRMIHSAIQRETNILTRVFEYWLKALEHDSEEAERFVYSRSSYLKDLHPRLYSDFKGNYQKHLIKCCFFNRIKNDDNNSNQRPKVTEELTNSIMSYLR